MRAAIKQIRFALIFPVAASAHVVKERAEIGCAIGHRDIDHLALAGGAGVDQGRKHAGDQEHRAAAIVGAEIERRHRSLFWPDRVEQAGESEIVDVVACGLGQWPILPPSCHPPVNKRGIAGQHHIGTQSQPLHDTRPVAFEYNVGFLYKTQAGLDRLWRFQVQADAFAPSGVASCRSRRRRTVAGDFNHLRAEVG